MSKHEVAPALIERANIASGVRTRNCAGPGTTSKQGLEVMEGWILRRSSRRCRFRRRSWPAGAPEALLEA
eukprot:2066799-Alexandrium_andersonii.AAC.1